MIDYKEAKKYLIPTLLDYGFRERKDKSCRAWRVFSDGSDVLLVKPNAQGEYVHYQSKTESGDYGDTVQFLMRRKLNKSYNLTAEEFCTIESELERIATCKGITYNTYMTAERQAFDISKYAVERLDVNAIPSAFRRFFDQRVIDPEQLAPFKTSIGVLVSDRGFKQPLFYWQNMQEQIVGAQYKYIKDGKCEKRFLKNTDRDSSLWMSPIDGRSGLFVTEDPLDAIAHYQLHPTANLAYLCTGGTSTKKQREMVRSIATKHNLPIILGNDNDLAGQLENFKLLETREIQHSINKNEGAVTLSIQGGEEATWQKEDLIIAIQQHIGTDEGAMFKLQVSDLKDWNDDLRASQKSITLKNTEKNISEFTKEHIGISEERML